MILPFVVAPTFFKHGLALGVALGAGGLKLWQRLKKRK